MKKMYFFSETDDTTLLSFLQADLPFPLKNATLFSYLLRKKRRNV